MAFWTVGEKRFEILSEIKGKFKNLKNSQNLKNIFGEVSRDGIKHQIQTLTLFFNVQGSKAGRRLRSQKKSRGSLMTGIYVNLRSAKKAVLRYHTQNLTVFRDLVQHHNFKKFNFRVFFRGM